MSYRLIKSSNFEKVAKKFLKKYPEKIAAFSLILKLLEQNPFDKSLKTHKLHGKLFPLWASSIDFSNRILYKIINLNSENEDDVILLVTVGTHEEVY